MTTPTHVASWPSLRKVPVLYPDARNRDNRGPVCYRAGKTWPLDSHPDTRGRIALLAVGSNAYPRQLHDKLAETAADLQGIPTVPTILRGFDVAYCPVRSRNGYIPVTLAPRPGAVCLTWLQWLTLEQLNIISATEGSRYALVGGESLAAKATIQAHLRRPPRIYAWWFDSVLEDNGSTVWMDVFRRRWSVDAGVLPARPNPIPSEWRRIHRSPGHHAIGQEHMNEFC